MSRAADEDIDALIQEDGRRRVFEHRKTMDVVRSWTRAEGGQRVPGRASSPPMPCSISKLIHRAGIFTMPIAFTLACVHVLRDGSRAARRSRRGIAIVHGARA